MLNINKAMFNLRSDLTRRIYGLAKVDSFPGLDFKPEELTVYGKNYGEMLVLEVSQINFFDNEVQIIDLHDSKNMVYLDNLSIDSLDEVLNLMQEKLLAYYIKK